MILHCMKKSSWVTRKEKEYWGARNLEVDGFIHCSTPELFWRVAPNFKDTDEELVLVCIDEKKLESEVKFEDLDNCGRYYPHVYGLINNSAVIQILPFLKDKFGNFLKNEELSEYAEE